METTKYILIGGGGHARVISSIVEAQKSATVVGLFDSNSEVKSLDGLKILERILLIHFQIRAQL